MFGMESCGKTTTCLQCVAACQKQGGVTAYIDAEHAVDPDWAAKLGVDFPSILFSQPQSGEEALNLVQDFVESGLIDLVIVDSVAALVPQSEVDNEVGASSIGAQARMMSQAMRKLYTTKSRTSVVFINQIRQKIGIMFGSPDTTPGGLALKFAASARILITKSTPIKIGDSTCGWLTRAKVVKNKVGVPFKTALFNMFSGDTPYGKDIKIYGIDKYFALVDIAKEIGEIKTTGSWYVFNDTKIGNGIDNVIKELYLKPELFNAIKTKLYERFKNYSVIERSDEEIAETIDDEGSADEAE